MNFKRTILFGALIWVIIFFEICVLMFGFNLKPPTINYANYAISVIIVGFLAHLYFNEKKVRKSFGIGILTGAIFALTGIVLDAIITVPLFIKSYNFFLDIYLWIGIIEGILITGIVAALNR